MTPIEKLKSTKTLSDVAHLLGYTPKSLSYILYVIPENIKYTEFEISKKHGGIRKICKPDDRLKLVQKRLADLLNDCFEEITREKNFKHSLSHGFRKNHSIITNARKHTNKKYIFNLDLSDFFPSINLGRVRGFFIKSEDFALEPKIATILAQIACHKNELPQGSPCSPIISNLIGHLLDIRLVKLAKRAKCTYSRYADDITFSTNEKIFPSAIAIYADNKKEKNNWTVSEKLRSEIEKMGFSINYKKVTMQNSFGRQMTTGLVVNEKVNIKRDYYKETRSMCHSLFLNGSFFRKKTSASKNFKKFTEENNIDPSSPEFKIVGSLKQLEGRLSYIYNIQKESYQLKLPKPNAIKLSKIQSFLDADKLPVTKSYGKFLFYKYFFALEKPTIVCEGKTDPIYLTCALKALSPCYPSLVNKNINGELDLYFNFLAWSKTFHEVFSLPQGSQGIKYIINMYKGYMSSFKGKGKLYPVILLIDNDNGSNDIFSLIYSIMKCDIDKNKPFYHVFHNLYVVATPLTSDNKETKIEDFFEDHLLNIEIEGKKFSNNNKKDGENNTYGKTVFAEKVIKAKQYDINFEKFKPILDRIIQAIEHFKNLSS